MHRHQFVCTGTALDLPQFQAGAIAQYACDCGERISVISNGDISDRTYPVEGELFASENAPKDPACLAAAA